MKRTSKLKKLPIEDQKHIFELCEQFTYPKVCQILAQPRGQDGGLSVQTNPPALSRFYSHFGWLAGDTQLLQQFGDLLKERPSECLLEAVTTRVGEKLFRELNKDEIPILKLTAPLRVYHSLKRLGFQERAWQRRNRIIGGRPKPATPTTPHDPVADLDDMEFLDLPAPTSNETHAEPPTPTEAQTQTPTQIPTETPTPKAKPQQRRPQHQRQHPPQRQIQRKRQPPLTIAPPPHALPANTPNRKSLPPSSRPTPLPPRQSPAKSPPINRETLRKIPPKTPAISPISPNCNHTLKPRQANPNPQAPQLLNPLHHQPPAMFLPSRRPIRLQPPPTTSLTSSTPPSRPTNSPPKP